ncbi:MAG: DUF5703 domain-containing protein [Parabacteroides gordonii]|nr:DUF5703 domain-containing protein [Parabacteroides gordonii]
MAGKTEATVKSKLKQYNVVWEEQSVGSKESMPLSGCNGYGANVWMEEGTLFLYLASNNSYDENGNLLKLGGVRVQMEPNLFDPASGFRQELDLYNSRITLSGKDKKGQTASYTLWIDPVYNEVHLEANSSVPTKIMASFITWRDWDAVVNQDNWNRQGAETTKADLVETAGDKLVWYHRNQESDVLDKMLEKQNFTAYKDLIPDITRNRISGGLITGKDLKYTGERTFCRRRVEWYGLESGNGHSKKETSDPYDNEFGAGTGTIGVERQTIRPDAAGIRFIRKVMAKPSGSLAYLLEQELYFY